MGSPDGNGSSTGEGRKGALLLLRGGGPPEADGTSERASTLPSSNALRPDSGLNLGWYRPTAPEQRPRDPQEQDGPSGQHAPGRADEREPMVTAATTPLDLRAESALSDPNDSPLGVRRPRNTLFGTSSSDGGREGGLACVGFAKLRGLTAVRFGPGAGEVRKRALSAGLVAVLLAAVGFGAVTALEQSSSPQRSLVQSGGAVSGSQLRRTFLSAVASGLDALNRSGFRASAGTAIRARSGSDAHSLSRTSEARAGHARHTMASRVSASSGHAPPVSRGAATGESRSQESSSVGSGSEIQAAQTPAQTRSEAQTPVQQAPTQQTSTEQPVHYQPPAQPAGPAGLGSQVGGNCDPKCS
jgi:hypothetical protein